MIVHHPELSYSADEVILSAHIEYEQPVQGFPSSLWFAFPREYEPILTPKSDPFAVALLQTSQYLNEELHVRGSISERLAYGLEQYGAVFNIWFPKWFSPPKLSYDSLTKNSPSPQPKVAMAFSGGVDSFYTLYKHLPQNQSIPSARLNTALFLHGMDIRFYEADSYQRLTEKYRDLFSHLGLEFWIARMNAYLFWEHRIRWEYVHGAPLIATALCFRNISRFYIPATHRYDFLLNNATSPLTDHWLSTETTEIVHHGCDMNRLQKLEVISSWDIPKNYLRVCTDPIQRQGKENCGKCNKCLRTMIMLDLLGCLHTYRTLPNKVTWKHWLRYILTVPGQTYPKTILAYALSRHRYHLAFLAWIGTLIGKTRRSLSEWLIGRISKETVHSLKHRIFFRYAESNPDHAQHP